MISRKAKGSDELKMKVERRKDLRGKKKQQDSQF
jgi:hypothetical protein